MNIEGNSVPLQSQTPDTSTVHSPHPKIRSLSSFMISDAASFSNISVTI